MSRALVFRPQARAEFDDALDWYSDRGRGEDFLARVQETLNRIGANPKLHQVVRGVSRRAVVQKTPYVVIYHEEDDTVVVDSVFHTSRDPAEWQRRVDPPTGAD